MEGFTGIRAEILKLAEALNWIEVEIAGQYVGGSQGAWVTWLHGMDRPGLAELARAWLRRLLDSRQVAL